MTEELSTISIGFVDDNLNANVRTLRQGESLWFCAVDICNILQLKQSSHVTRYLDSDEVTSVIINHSGRPVKTNFVSEPGLYHLLRATGKTEMAKKFGRWIDHEVLPTIRRTGAYAMPGSENAELAAMRDAIREKADKEFRERVFTRAVGMHNYGITPEEEEAISKAAIAFLKSGVALTMDNLRGTTAPMPTFQRYIDGWKIFGDFLPHTRLEAIQATGGFVGS